MFSYSIFFFFRKSRWRENIKNREQRIQEEIATISILHRDSTLPKDLEEKIRKKLTLTEVIVLAEPPLELPDLNDDMLDLIRLAVTLTDFYLPFMRSRRRQRTLVCKYYVFIQIDFRN